MVRLCEDNVPLLNDISNIETEYPFSLSPFQKHAIDAIISGNHTIITVIDYDNCKQSASWGACMPFTEGYIKKGKLEHQEDYMNNIVGLPDSQKRTAYLFN